MCKMKGFVYIAIVLFVSIVAVQGYGPRIQRKKHRGSQKSSHRSHESDEGPPEKPHHRPHDFRPPKQHSNWDHSPVWDDRSDSWEDEGDRGPYRPDYSDDPADYSRERDSSHRYRSSDEEYGDWYYHRYPKHWRQSHNKEPPNTPGPKPTTPTPIPTTPQPVTTAHTIPLIPTLPPHPAHTRFTSNPIETTEAFTNPTTAQVILRPMRTASSILPTPPSVDTTDRENNTNPVPETRSFIPLTTTTPNPEVETTTVEEEFITLSPEMEACIESCLSTPEYNPVCGSNGVTYNNEGKLFCAASCGVNVTLVRRSVCPPPNWEDYDDGPVEPPSPTTTNTTPSRGRTTLLSDFQRCMRLCDITAIVTPVCGTDRITYMNMDRLKCAQRCGEDVEVLCEKPCASCRSNPVTPEKTILRPSTTPEYFRSTQEPGIQDCISGCPITMEYNPVCGSNHVTYGNPSRLICAQLCGVGVTALRLGPCGSTTTTTSSTTIPTLSPDDVLRCIRGCPVTTEYDPVCGTDDLTYNNLGNLECSKFCGVDVGFKHKSRCVDEFDLGPDGTDSTPPQTTQGNKDHVSKPSQSTTKTTPLVTSSTTATTTLKSTSTTTTGQSSSSTFGFTIPNDVLIDIFGPTTTKPKNPDEDENIDLDVRFNSDTDTDKDTDRGRSSSSKIIFPD